MNICLFSERFLSFQSDGKRLRKLKMREFFLLLFVFSECICIRLQTTTASGILGYKKGFQ